MEKIINDNLENNIKNNLENNIKNNLENNLNNNLEKKQTNFLDSLIGKAINSAIDIGIRAILPDFIEDQIINVKDNLIKYGLKDGIKETIQDSINIGKSAIGILTGKFENATQMKEAVKQGGIIDGVSSVLDFAIEKANNKGKIDNKTASLLQNGKDIILNNVESNIEKSFEKENKNEVKLSEYINEWKEHYKNKDFNNMEKTFNKIDKELKEIAPLEDILKEARTIENLHTLIKNNGQNFNLNENELELVKNL